MFNADLSMISTLLRHVPELDLHRHIVLCSPRLCAGYAESAHKYRHVSFGPFGRRGRHGGGHMQRVRNRALLTVVISVATCMNCLLGRVFVLDSSVYAASRWLWIVSLWSHSNSSSMSCMVGSVAGRQKTRSPHSSCSFVDEKLELWAENLAHRTLL